MVKKLEIVADSPLKQFQDKYQTALDFPRTFDPFSGNNIIPGIEREGFLSGLLPDFQAQPEELQKKALKIQERYWANYSRLDEIEFDYANDMFDQNGVKELDSNFSISGHVWLKYGYGMEIKGHDARKNPIHWVFNMDGDVTLPTVKEMNLSSLFRSFFDLSSALPEMVTMYGEIVDNVDLPKNPHVAGHGKYDEVDVIRSKPLPLQLKKYHYYRTYYSRTTGMPELVAISALEDQQEIKAFLENESNVPKPNVFNEVKRYIECQGIYMLTEISTYKEDIEKSLLLYRDSFNNIKVQLLTS